MFGSHLFQTSCPQYTGVADKDIQTSECTNRFVDQFAQTGRIGYIGLNENRSVTFSQGVEILCSFRSSNFVQVGNDDVGALLNQPSPKPWAAPVTMIVLFSTRPAVAPALTLRR